MDQVSSIIKIMLVICSGLIIGSLVANHGEITENYEKVMDEISKEEKTVKGYEDDLVFNEKPFNAVQTQLNGKNITYYRGRVPSYNNLGDNWSSTGRYLSHPYWLNGSNGRVNQDGVDRGLSILYRTETLSNEVKLEPGDYRIKFEAANVARLSNIYDEDRICQELKLALYIDGEINEKWIIENEDHYETFEAEFVQEKSFLGDLNGVEDTSFKLENTGNEECTSQVQHLGIESISIQKTGTDAT